MVARARTGLVLVVALLVVAAGCSGAGGGGAAGPNGGGDRSVGRTAVATGTPMPEATMTAGGADQVGTAPVKVVAQRQLVRTGKVSVQVDDFASAQGNLTRATERYGGFVSDTRQVVHRVDNQTWTEGVVVLRVPRENFTALFERAKTEGELDHAEQNSQDVTDQLVDLRARLDNLRAERDRLRELYRRANDTETVLEVQDRLSAVQGEIERLEAHQQAIRQRVALSTITVQLHEARPEPNHLVGDRWYDVPLVGAFLASVDGVVVTLRALAVAGAYALPYLVVFGVPLVAVGYAVRRRRRFRPPGRLGRLGRWRSRERSDEPPSKPDDGPPDDDAG